MNYWLTRVLITMQIWGKMKSKASGSCHIPLQKHCDWKKCCYGLDVVLSNSTEINETKEDVTCDTFCTFNGNKHKRALSWQTWISVYSDSCARSVLASVKLQMLSLYLAVSVITENLFLRMIKQNFPDLDSSLFLVTSLQIEKRKLLWQYLWFNFTAIAINVLLLFHNVFTLCDELLT